MSKPAFPRPYSEWHEEGIKHELPQQQGMSMLEFYTGKALLGCQNLAIAENQGGDIEQIALDSVTQAEAIIKELEKRSQ